TAQTFVFENYGSPQEVLKVKSHQLPPLDPYSVYIQFLAFPINPADINQVQGTYPVKPLLVDNLGYIGGNEGVAKVIQVGEKVKSLKKGDWVIPGHAGFGTWRTHAAAHQDDLVRISSDISPISAATLSVNPCTAYRMLRDFVDLKQGDVIIQNGANSAVGQAVIQLAAAWGYKSINIVRDRPNLPQLVEELKALGATYVVTDSNLRKESKSISSVLGGRTISLGLNCVGGKSATEVARTLGQNGVLVTYGGMSREPVTLPTSLFIFKNLAAKGFWMTRWSSQASLSERQSMFEDIVHLIRQKKFREPWSEV
ncbi:hypothetical protein BKA69DRAFT_1020642, partial [Paraphysoderma sedebokerense]